MTKLYTFRLTSEGLDEFKKDLQQAGDQGEAALKKITDATPGLAGAMDLAAQKADQARQKLEQAAQGSGEFSKATTVATEVLGAFGVALSVEQVASWAKGIATSTALLVDQAKQLQVSTDALQAYHAAFQQSGSSADEADKILARVNQQIGDSVDNVGEARRQLSEWNLDWKDLAAAAPDQRLALIAQGLLSIEDGTRRARAEQTLFGKSGHDVESVLVDLAGGIDQLTQKYKDFIVSQQTAKDAKAALDDMSASWEKLKVAAADPITDINIGLAAMLDKLNKIASSIANADWSKVSLAAANAMAMRPAGPGGPASMQSAAAPPDLEIPNDALNKLANLSAPAQSNSNLQAATDLLRQQAQYAQMSAEHQAEFTAQLALANAKLKDGLPDHQMAADYAGKEAVSQADINKILTPQQAAEAAKLGLMKAQGDQLKKTKETFDQFLAAEQESARLAGESVDQRNKEAAVIQAAQVAEKARGVEARDLSKTYAEAAQSLGAQKTAAIELAETEKSRNQLQHDLIQPLQDEVGLAGQTKEVREQELEILKLKQQYGATAVSQSEDELRNLLKQKDAMTADDIIRDLKEQVSLAGMTADEAERQKAVLDAMHATHQNLSADQATEISQLVQARQEAERWQGVVTGVTGDFQNFFQELPGKGLGAFQDLGSAIKGEFTQLLAWMASQALVQPVIIPMVQSFAGAFGLQTSTGGAGSPFQLLSTAGSASSLFGSGSSGALSGLFGSTGGTGGSLAAAGSLLSQILPGAAIAYASSLLGTTVFGNKNDTGIGGALLGLPGAFLGSIDGSSNNGSIYNFDSTGTSGYLFKQGGGNNGQAATQAAGEVQAVISALQAQGVSVSMGNITGLSIGSDKSYVYSANGGKQKLDGGDVDGVVSAILGQILPSATGGSADVQTVLSHYMQSGGINTGNLSQLSSDLGFAKSLSDLDLSTQDLTQSEQALKAINDQYQQLIDKAAALGLSTDQIETARQAAIQSLIDGFDDSVSTALKQIQDPLGAAADALSAQQAQRIKEATALGADLTQVYALNAAETQQLTAAQAAQAAQQAAAAQQTAQQLSDFNFSIANDIESYTNSLQAQLDAEDRAGQQRIQQAQAIGADINAVEQDNALKRQKIIDDSNAQQLAATQQQVAAAQAAALQQQQATAAAQSSLSGLVQSLITGDNSSLSPDQKYFLLLTQYNKANSAVLSSPTDPGAISSFDSAASALLPVAHEFLGTSQKYGALENSILSTATQVGGSLADPSGLGQAMVNAQVQGSGAIVETIGLTNDKLDQLAKDFSNLSAVVQAILNRAA